MVAHPQPGLTSLARLALMQPGAGIRYVAPPGAGGSQAFSFCHPGICRSVVRNGLFRGAIRPVLPVGSAQALFLSVSPGMMGRNILFR